MSEPTAQDMLDRDLLEQMLAQVIAEREEARHIANAAGDILGTVLVILEETQSILKTAVDARKMSNLDWHRT